MTFGARRGAKLGWWVAVASVSAALALAINACVPDYASSNDGGAPEAGAHDGSHPVNDAAVDGDASRALPDAGPETGTDPGSDAGPETGGGEVSAALLSFLRAPVAVGEEEYGNAICAIHAGALYCWGDTSNGSGYLGFPSPPPDSGITTFPRPTRTLPNDAGLPLQMTIGGATACSLHQDRQVFCRGSNDDNNFANPAGVDGPMEFAVQGLADHADVIAEGGDFTCAVTFTPSPGSAGNVYCWGGAQVGELGRTDTRPGTQAWAVVTMQPDGGGPDGIHDGIWVAASNAHACAVTASGKILCWGTTGNYESGPNAGTKCDQYQEAMCSGVPQEVKLPAGEVPVQVALGGRHSCALTKAQHVYCWGDNTFDQLGQTTAQPTCPLPEAGVAMNTDAAASTCSPGPVLVPGLSNVAFITAGFLHTCALDTQQHVSCWGGYFNASLGRGDCPSQGPCPALGAAQVIDVNTLRPIAFDYVVAGGYKTCGMSQGTLLCWGQQELGTITADGGEPDPAYATPVNF